MSRVKTFNLLGSYFTQLTLITLAVVITTIVVNVIIWSSTQSVSDRTNLLIRESIPQLKVISNLENNVNQRILQLYIYYSTTDIEAWKEFENLQDIFHEEMSKLKTSNAIFDYHHALNQASESLNKNALLFHKEMQN